MKRIVTLAIVGFVGAGLLGGCGSSEKKAAPAAVTPTANMSIVNSKCPMMPDHPIDPTATAEYKGQKVGFCCSECIPDWTKLPPDQKDARLVKFK